VSIGPFEMDVDSVRNDDWLEFIRQGGYQRPELWGADGWDWRQRTHHAHPAFWHRAGAGWIYRTMFDELALDDVLHWPVYVSWAEARAYAHWKNANLPTEAEFHRAAEGVSWGDPAGGNYGFAHWSPVSVGRREYRDSAHGIRDLVGNGWEWTSSRFAPFPGFKPWARTYPGYSADFFDEQHYVMLGASWATDATLVRRSFRNWFQPHYPYVFAKFRTVVR
jgi:formylglycine-generating enzyme required for sulfatase activity